ncbi:hypothetical protein BD769DRAFT_1663117 [Suillus cothurnatus]|nr:hypothetical protein BD769DRAFT_1663117 [Suillus cothurnatus]
MSLSIMVWAMIQNCSSLLQQVSMIGHPAIISNPKDCVAASNSSPLVEVLVPTEHRPQGFDPTVPADAVEESGRICLMPSTDYLRSNNVLNALGVPRSDVQAFLDFCTKAKVYSKQEEVKLPAPGGPPVQLIADPSQGLACITSAECTYCTKHVKTLQRHGRQKHGSSGLMEIQYKPCLIQHIFTSIANLYFEIGDSVLPGIRPDLKAMLKASFLPAFNVPLVVLADTEQERTPLVKCMGWDKFMPNVHMNPAQRQAVEQIKKKYSEEEHGSLLSCLAIAIKDHMEKASTILDGHPHRLSLLKILLYGDAIPRDQENHWRPMLNDNVVYPNFMIQLMHSIVRIHLGFPLNFSFALSAKQTQHLEDLLTVLGDDASTDHKRMVSYHELAWSLVDAKLTQCIANCWANPIHEPSTLTPDLAKFKYLCNATLLLEVLLDKDRDADSMHTDDDEHVAQVHHRAVHLGSPTTFNFIYEMQQYALSLAFNQTKEPNVYVDLEVRSITISTQTMVMEKLQEGIQGLLRDFKL